MNPTTYTHAIKYVVISPVRDEGQNIEATIEAVVSQSIKPAQWIIVDDGSTDQTGRLIDNAAQEHEWISALHMSNRGFRQPGTGVMEAFYYGYDSLKCQDWEFIVKLDGDVGFESDYFQRCFAEFRKDSRLGVGGGVMFCERNGRLQEEVQPRFHVRGPTKIYRRGCWEAIASLIKAPGWDTVDEVKANMLGWRTESFPGIHALHRRPTGAEQGSWRDAIKNGRADFISGYHPMFMGAKCVKRMYQRPYIVGGIGHLYGFCSSHFNGTRRVSDPAVIRYIRRQQIRKLLHLDTIWK